MRITCTIAVMLLACSGVAFAKEGEQKKYYPQSRTEALEWAKKRTQALEKMTDAEWEKKNRPFLQRQQQQSASSSAESAPKKRWDQMTPEEQRAAREAVRKKYAPQGQQPQPSSPPAP